MNFFGKKTGSKNITHSTETTDNSMTATPASTTSAIPTRSYKLLNSTQLQRTKEMLKLAETKLQNIENNIKLLQKQQEWFRKYSELKMSLEQAKAKLFELNKQQASMIGEARMLERYESLEYMEETFLRVSILESQRTENIKRLCKFEREIETLQKEKDEQEKKVKHVSEEKKLIHQRFVDMHDNLLRGYGIKEANTIINLEKNYLNSIASKVKEQIDVMEVQITEQKNEVALLEQELERHRAGRQSIEMHSEMVEHGESVIVKLEFLHELETQLKELHNRQIQANKKQNEENEQLQRIFTKYQDIMSQINTLEDEIATHRHNIQGQDSFKLQERAMSLKSRIQMLQAAQSLWKRISTGYSIIEDKERTLNELKLHVVHAEDMAAKLEIEAGKTERLCNEKEYTFLLSKGQNVIQLRTDLKEGENCPVCGASHHPYHSDTMLEQSKLIGEFKTDYEILEQEVRGKRKAVNEAHMDLAESKGRMMAEEQALHTAKLRQNEDVKEWRFFATLDKQFEDCSASTNMEARSVMLRQLQENTIRDAEQAQKELDIFNFHQTRITELSEKLQALELKKTELGTRLNELNTGCQVMAGQTDRIQALIETCNSKYSQLYEDLDKTITIKDWLNEWKRSHEGLRNHIQQLISAWQTINEHIGIEQRELALEKLKLENMTNELDINTNEYNSIMKRLEAITAMTNEKDAEYKQILNDVSPKQYFTSHYNELQKAELEEAKELETLSCLQRKMDRVRGRNESYAEIAEKTDVNLSEERSRLDIWMHTYNAQNPPTQYQELKNVFDNRKDWNASRHRIRNTCQEAAVCQAKVDDLNSRFIALQGESGFRNINRDNIQEEFAQQMESLYLKRNEVMLQIARATIVLEEHEKARQQQFREDFATE